VLLAEDDGELRALIAHVLRAEGYIVAEVADGEQLLCMIADSLDVSGSCDRIDLIITDVRMPVWTGIEVMTAARAAGSRIPFIVLTAFGDAEIHEKARSLDAVSVFDKPFDMSDLRVAVRRVLPPGCGSPDPSATRLRVLVASDDDGLRSQLAAQLRFDGHHVVELTSGIELDGMLGNARVGGGIVNAFDVIVADAGLPFWPCLESLKDIRENGWNIPVILLTGLEDERVRLGLSGIGYTALLPRSVEIGDLRIALYKLSLWQMKGVESHGHVL